MNSISHSKSIRTDEPVVSWTAYRLEKNCRPSVFRRNKHDNKVHTWGLSPMCVGMTDGLPIAKAELEKGDAQRMVLLWASRTWDDTFWKEDIAALTTHYPNTFTMVHILSREEHDGCLYGRVNPEVLQQVFQPTESEEARFLSVGTKEMMRMTDGYFATNHYDMPKHHLIPKM
mmetsp:Transcript_12842/g.14067  ORF Transcript_12842/g.14067 Transcript_12842/m.14067 type:complete len:173 (-) Transcript_12842:271-789(-)